MRRDKWYGRREFKQDASPKTKTSVKVLGPGSVIERPVPTYKNMSLRELISMRREIDRAILAALNSVEESKRHYIQNMYNLNTLGGLLK